MGRDKDGHQLVQEVLTARMVREQGVSVDEVQVTLAGMGEPESELIHILG